MSPLVAMLSLYYLCDHVAATRGLDPVEVARCMANYERLKMSFVEGPPARLGSPERAAQIRVGYQGFKAWEAAHPDEVARLRAEGRNRATRFLR